MAKSIRGKLSRDEGVRKGGKQGGEGRDLENATTAAYPIFKSERCQHGHIHISFLASMTGEGSQPEQRPFTDASNRCGKCVAGKRTSFRSNTNGGENLLCTCACDEELLKEELEIVLIQELASFAFSVKRNPRPLPQSSEIARGPDILLASLVLRRCLRLVRSTGVRRRPRPSRSHGKVCATKP